jgi:hypothetical protein
MTIESPLVFPSLPPGAAGAREALMQAPPEFEAITNDEEELVARSVEDCTRALTYSHEHVKRLSVPDWKAPPRGFAASAARVRIEWTRTADMGHLGDPPTERRIHDALENLAAFGQGTVYALRERGEFRLHVGELRIRFRFQPKKITVLGTFKRERPMRLVQRTP